MHTGIKVEQSSFWFVWTKTGSLPRVTHPTRLSAEAEACRLARKHPDRKFIVLAAEHKYSALPRVTATEAQAAVATLEKYMQENT